MATTLQEQARALCDRTRHEIFRYIADPSRRSMREHLAAHVWLP
jgi:hypothetical protein